MRGAVLSTFLYYEYKVDKYWIKMMASNVRAILCLVLTLGMAHASFFCYPSVVSAGQLLRYIDERPVDPVNYGSVRPSARSKYLKPPQSTLQRLQANNFRGQSNKAAQYPALQSSQIDSPVGTAKLVQSSNNFKEAVEAGAPARLFMRRVAESVSSAILMSLSFLLVAVFDSASSDDLTVSTSTSTSTSSN